MTEKNKVFFAADGITATSANHLCNIGWSSKKDLRFEIKHNWYTYSSLFVHKLIIRNYRILL